MNTPMDIINIPLIQNGSTLSMIILLPILSMKKIAKIVPMKLIAARGMAARRMNWLGSLSENSLDCLIISGP
jgi:hypothetical protein